jgi:hypothetical protein
MIKFILIFLIYLLNFNTSNLVLKIAPTFLYCLVIFDNIYNSRGLKNNLKFDFTFIIFIVLVIIAVLRNNHPEQSKEFNYFRIVNFLLIVIAFSQTFKTHFRFNENNSNLFFIKTIIFPLFLLMILNIIGYFLNLNNESTVGVASGDSKAVLLSNIGVNLTRVSFPFSPGFNSYGSLIGILFFTSLYCYLFIKQYRKFILFSLFFSMLTIALVDTRSAFFVSILFIPMFYVLQKTKKPKLLWLLPLITVFGNFIIIFVLTIISQIPELSFLERNSGDLETGNARTIIWGFSSLEFFNFKWIHLIGQGEFGHFASGVSSQWAYIFSKWENPELTSPHSSLFLILFDYGYLGLLLIVIMQYKIIAAVKVYWNFNRGISILLFSFVLYLNILGMTESFFGLYTTKILIVFTLISFYSIQIVNLKKEHV